MNVDKEVFLIDFVNEVYRACDFLDVPVPEGIDGARDLEDLLDIARRLSCRLVPSLVSSRVQETNAILSEEELKKLDLFFGALPSFRLKVLPNPGYPVFVYRVGSGETVFEALYFPTAEVCLIAKFSYRDLQMFKTPGDSDTDTRAALGRQARECVGFFRL